MSNPTENLLTKHLDVFKEIGNIGAGNAASALAGLLNKRISMTVPEASVVPFNTISNILDGPETLVSGVLVDVSGDLNGYILLIHFLLKGCFLAFFAIQVFYTFYDNLIVECVNKKLTMIKGGIF